MYKLWTLGSIFNLCSGDPCGYSGLLSHLVFPHWLFPSLMTLLCLHLKATLPQLMIQLYTGKSRNNLARTTNHPTNRLTNPPALSLGTRIVFRLCLHPCYDGRTILAASRGHPSVYFPGSQSSSFTEGSCTHSPGLYTNQLESPPKLLSILLITHPLTSQPALQPT